MKSLKASARSFFWMWEETLQNRKITSAATIQNMKFFPMALNPTLSVKIQVYTLRPGASFIDTRENPFSPPKAGSSSRRSRRGSPVWAVTAGALADVGGSLVVGVLVAIVAAAFLVTEGTPPEKVEAVLTSDPLSPLAIFGYLVGCGFSSLGGYLCARIAGYAEYRLAGIVAAISVSFGLLVSVSGGRRMPIALDALLVLATLGSVMLGAWRGAARNRSRAG
jgi:hypothetical protein